MLVSRNFYLDKNRNENDIKKFLYMYIVSIRISNYTFF